MGDEIAQMQRRMAATEKMVRQMSKLFDEMIEDLEDLPWEKTPRQEKLDTLETMARAAYSAAL